MNLDTGLIETKQVREALRMTESVMHSRTRVGRLVGEPGTGKTAISHALAEQFNGIRVCCSDGMTNKTLMHRLAKQLGVGNMKGSTDTLLERCADVCDGRALVFDEANHIKWQHMEKLRYLADEAGAGIVLIGTTLLEEPFRDGRTAVYLAQLARRIGTKQVRLTPMARLEEVTGYMIQPRFGAVPKTAAKLFKNYSRGYWGDADELAEGCQRIMQVQGIDKLNADVVEAAGADLAQRRAA